jgi:hypothetical protein
MQEDKENNMNNMSTHSVLNAFDFTAIDEMDPSLGISFSKATILNFAIAEGHSVLYDREAPFELRIQDANSGPQEVGTLEAIRVKILVLVIIHLSFSK